MMAFSKKCSIYINAATAQGIASNIFLPRVTSGLHRGWEGHSLKKKKRSIPHFWNVMLSDYLACEKTRNLGPLALLQFPFGFRHYNLDHFPTKIYKLIHIFFCLTQTTRGPD